MSTKAKSNKPPTPTEAYKGHRAGSRKAVIRELFDRESAEVAWVRGLKIGLKENTLRTWFSHWRTEDGTPAVKKKAATVATKPKAKVTPKATPKKTNSVEAPISKSDDGAPASA